MVDKIKFPNTINDRKLKIVIIITASIFIAATAWNVATWISTQSSTINAIESNINAAEQFCFNQEELAKQNRVRAKDEVILTKVALLQTYSAIAFAEGLPGDNQDTVEEFESTLPGLRHILATIHILPLPDCKMQGDKLRSELPPG